MIQARWQQIIIGGNPRGVAGDHMGSTSEAERALFQLEVTAGD